jgi:hypothetical protein
MARSTCASYGGSRSRQGHPSKCTGPVRKRVCFPAMATLNETAFTMLEGLFEAERDGSNTANHEKVFPDDDAFKSWNHALKVLKKEGLIDDGAYGVRISEKGRAEYLRLKAERE